mmetsp:Transcript_52327/g.125311  ORF Transcript_52327/g.125311 Transcript_52327/m.125311 type:complete len:220 (+) Transcript_52327:1379-2038(+)
MSVSPAPVPWTASCRSGGLGALAAAAATASGTGAVWCGSTGAGTGAIAWAAFVRLRPAAPRKASLCRRAVALDDPKIAFSRNGRAGPPAVPAAGVASTRAAAALPGRRRTMGFRALALSPRSRSVPGTNAAVRRRKTASSASGRSGAPVESAVANVTGSAALCSTPPQGARSASSQTRSRPASAPAAAMPSSFAAGRPGRCGASAPPPAAQATASGAGS